MDQETVTSFAALFAKIADACVCVCKRLREIVECMLRELAEWTADDLQLGLAVSDLGLRTDLLRVHDP